MRMLESISEYVREEVKNGNLVMKEGLLAIPKMYVSKRVNKIIRGFSIRNYPVWEEKRFDEEGLETKNLLMLVEPFGNSIDGNAFQCCTKKKILRYLL
jgi:hypothetical protein